MGVVQARLLPAGAGSLAPVPGMFLAMLARAHRPAASSSSATTPPRIGAAFKAYLAPLRNTEWVVYAKRPFGGPQAVLAYLARYTHRVAISNRRLISADETGVTFQVEGLSDRGARPLQDHDAPHA